MTAATLVRKSCYQDSVTLLAMARALRGAPGVREAAALMGTPANHDLMRQAGLLTAEAGTAGPNDLVIVVQADSDTLAHSALARAEELLTARQRRLESAGRIYPRTLDSARRRLPGANLALISVPGVWAPAEARKALRMGLHVMLWSDNVSLEDELALKRLARERGLLLMGPDCGTAYLNGVPLGFANVVPRGRIGLVAASGTGLQQVACLLAAGGEGISQAIGVGGRDMSDAVGGLMTLEALDALGADPATELVVVIGKPSAPEVRRKVEDTLGTLGKPAVVAMLGRDVRPARDGKIQVVATLEDAARAALAVVHGERWTPRAFSGDSAATAKRIALARATLGRGQRAVHGLFTGGTLAYEAVLLLESLLGPVSGNLRTRPCPRPRPSRPRRGHGGRNRRRPAGSRRADREARGHGRLGAALQCPGRASRGRHRGSRTLIRELFACDVRVINCGLEGFALDLEELGVPVIHVQWSPPAGGDPHKAALLAALEDDEEEDPSRGEGPRC